MAKKITSNNPCVRLLSSTLELARSGEISSVVVLYVTDDGESARDCAGELDADYQQMVYLCEAQKRDLLTIAEDDE